VGQAGQREGLDERRGNLYVINFARRNLRDAHTETLLFEKRLELAERGPLSF